MRSNLNFRDAAPAKPGEGAEPGPIVREPRTRTLLIATISRLDNSLSTHCVVGNISSGGARITVSEAVVLRGEFKVHIPQRNLLRKARQVWRKGDQLGVAFLPDQDDESENIRKINALEAEVASLRTEIGVLKYQLYQRDEVKAR